MITNSCELVLCKLLNSSYFSVWISAGESMKTKNTAMPFTLASHGLLIEDKAGDNKKIKIEFSDASNVLLTFILTKASATSWTYQFQVHNLVVISNNLTILIYRILRGYYSPVSHPPR